MEFLFFFLIFLIKSCCITSVLRTSSNPVFSYKVYKLLHFSDVHYNLMARVTPSPTVSMFRLIRASLYSFLFSLSMATVSASSGDGFSTFPPHSTCSTRHIFIQVLPLELARCKNLCVSCLFWL